MRQTKVILADDHRMIRKAWKLMLDPHKHLSVIAEAENGTEVISLCEKELVNLVLMDIEMPELNGVETTKILTERSPFTKVIIISMFSDRHYVKKLFSAGAKAYLTKNSTEEELIKAIEVVRSGGKYIASELQNSFIDEAIKEDTEEKKLTKREKEIIRLISEGCTSKSIAEKLFVSLKTVECHRTNIYKKLNVKNVMELIMATKKISSF